MRGGYRGPVQRMLERAAAERTLRFHMPGHKGIVAMPGADLDITELPGTDTLFEPAHGLLQAQKAAATCWNASVSFLLVNGSTAGIQAMALWAALQGRALLAPRDCHCSLLYACALAGLQPVWLEPGWDAGKQLFSWNTQIVAGRLPVETSAVFITYPDYYGRCLDLKQLHEVISSRDSELLADSAHGAHFTFGNRFPPDAGEYARLWVSGAHKTLPAPTQTAFLHAKIFGDAPDVARMLRGVTTTSPSWPMLAGLDNSRLIMQSSKAELDALAENCLSLAARLNRLDGIRCRGETDARAEGFAAHDPTRLVVDVRGLGMTGWEAGAKLRGLGVQAEMCDACRVVLIATVVDGKRKLDRLYRAFTGLARMRGDGKFAAGMRAVPKPGQMALTLRQAWLSQAESVPLKEAVGRVAAEPFGAYPPGIPLCMPGEEIGREALDAAAEALELGGSLFGASNGTISVVKQI